jgi:hypothetical protein
MKNNLKELIVTYLATVLTFAYLESYPFEIKIFNKYGKQIWIGRSILWVQNLQKSFGNISKTFNKY